MWLIILLKCTRIYSGSTNAATTTTSIYSPKKQSSIRSKTNLFASCPAHLSTVRSKSQLTNAISEHKLTLLENAVETWKSEALLLDTPKIRKDHHGNYSTHELGQQRSRESLKGSTKKISTITTPEFPDATVASSPSLCSTSATAFEISEVLLGKATTDIRRCSVAVSAAEEHPNLFTGINIDRHRRLSFFASFRQKLGRKRGKMDPVTEEGYDEFPAENSVTNLQPVLTKVS
ncbi:unnamed protein product [Enterobius vermicularis]|uniref:Uncharacterized protein n=1 Tax=Enterobius vermicularis TaxID=51028 RepID=A0A0N4VB02_ENTVE|nr:unnamed protein product [Enterobius vermicularis]